MVLLCAGPPKLLKVKKEKLAEIELDKDAVDGNLSNILSKFKIPGTDYESPTAKLVNELKSEIEKFFKTDISDIKSLLDLV